MKNRFSFRLIHLLFVVFFFQLFISQKSIAQNFLKRFESIDVKNYVFHISVNDSSNEIIGKAIINIQFKKPLTTLQLDLKNINSDGNGMQVDEVSDGNIKLDFSHENDQLLLFIDSTKTEELRNYVIKYHGIPSDGLIIGENKFGERVFFGDNWPNRAQHWLPTVDHPSDKATLEFIVQAPSHYQVVANGLLIEESNYKETIISHWKTIIPLPTKVMVIGIARFAKQNYFGYNDLPISTWVYPQNRDAGFSDYQIARNPIEFFSKHIATFPFEKLANVQSNTIYGGMENAGCIFYAERSVNGKNTQEGLFAHEIAHQWFGDAVSELDWPHLWLSEGFATYFTGLYIEHQKGETEFKEWMQKQKQKVIRYANHKLNPVVDTNAIVSIGLLNANTYQKGAWVLHMLRKELGDEVFWKCIKNYYTKYKHKNATTEDFIQIVETVSGKDLNHFFTQWLNLIGHPKLDYNWKYDEHSIQLQISQLQEQPAFIFPIEILITYEDGSTTIENLQVNIKEEKYIISCKKRPVQIILDPNSWLLYEPLSDLDKNYQYWALDQKDLQIINALAANK